MHKVNTSSTASGSASGSAQYTVNTPPTEHDIVGTEPQLIVLPTFDNHYVGTHTKLLSDRFRDTSQTVVDRQAQTGVHQVAVAETDGAASDYSDCASMPELVSCFEVLDIGQPPDSPTLVSESESDTSSSYPPSLVDSSGDERPARTRHQ